MGIFIALLILAILFWPSIKRWAASYMARKAEDYIRQATGMPPRPDSRKGKKDRKNSRFNGNAESSRFGRQRARHTASTHPSGPLIPKEYAVDVEFTETIDYSKPTIHTTHREKTKVESQVSDAEWVDIKEPEQTRKEGKKK